MVSTFCGLPLDILTEILSCLPALSILSCREVCRKLNHLSKARYIWITVFNRTQHMLRPMVPDLAQIPLTQLQMIMARAEKLDQMWSNEAILNATRPRIYRIEYSEGRDPVALMRNYIIFHTEGLRFQWISRCDVAGENVVLEYIIPEGVLPEQYYMDHASGIFYVVVCSKTTKEPVLVTQFELDAITQRPRLTTCSRIKLKGDRVIGSLSVTNHFICFYDPDFSIQTPSNLDILDLRTGAVSQLHLLHPPFSPDPYSKVIRVSEVDILLIVNGRYFSVYRRRNLEDETTSTLSPTHLEVSFSGMLPPWFCNKGYLVPTTSPAFIGFGSRNYDLCLPSSIYLGFPVESPELEELVVKTSVPITGYILSPRVFFTPPPPQIRYTLGMLTTTKYTPYEGDEYDCEGTPNGVCLYALRFETFGPQRELTMDDVKVTRMDLTPWLEKFEDDLYVVDFDPFSGTAVLGSYYAFEKISKPPILVLDYLDTE